jgi:hypothetical protein
VSCEKETMEGELPPFERWLQDKANGRPTSSFDLRINEPRKQKGAVEQHGYTPAWDDGMNSVVDALEQLCV